MPFEGLNSVESPSVDHRMLIVLVTVAPDHKYMSASEVPIVTEGTLNLVVPRPSQLSSPQNTNELWGGVASKPTKIYLGFSTSIFDLTDVPMIDTAGVQCRG